MSLAKAVKSFNACVSLAFSPTNSVFSLLKTFSSLHVARVHVLDVGLFFTRRNSSASFISVRIVLCFRTSSSVRR